MRLSRVLGFALLTVQLFGSGAFGEVIPSERDAGQPTATTPPSGPHWRFITTYCEGIKPISDPEHGVYWSGEVLPDGIMATYIETDKTDANHPVELKSVFNWGWQLDPAPDPEFGNLYPDEEVTILMTLEYTGIDPKVRTNRAEMYAGAFHYYPQDNDLLIDGPGGILEKEVVIPIPEGIEPGQQSTIDIVCTGSVPHQIIFYYVYEWVS